MGALDFSRSEAHDAAVERSASGPGTVGEVALLERVAFSQALVESLASVAAGEGRVVLVSGEAGIGKSALVRSFCDARRDAARVLWGACDALGTPRPLSPLTDIAVAVKGALLSRVDEGDKPHAVFVALAEELRAVTPTIVVLEDVHWADEATLDVIRLLARRAEALGALIVLTYRDDELDAMHPLRLAVGELGTSPGVVRLRLPPLSRAAVEELANAHDVDAGELYDQTGGNPFYVTEVWPATASRFRRRCAMPCSPACTAWVLRPRACSRRSPSSHRISSCGSWTRSSRTRSSTSTPVSRPACCATRGTRSRSVTSSPGSPSRNRSAPADGCCSTAGCWRPPGPPPEGTVRSPTRRRAAIHSTVTGGQDVSRDPSHMQDANAGLPGSDVQHDPGFVDTHSAFTPSDSADVQRELLDGMHGTGDAIGNTGHTGIDS